MFRNSCPQRPYSFEIAAGRILNGWKAAGQPILTNAHTEKNLTNEPENNVCTPLIEKTSQLIDMLQFNRGLGDASTDKLLKLAYELNSIVS